MNNARGQATSEVESAYRLGVRDARLGHAESHPVHPYTVAEYHAYQQGYSDQRITESHKG